MKSWVCLKYFVHYCSMPGFMWCIVWRFGISHFNILVFLGFTYICHIGFLYFQFYIMFIISRKLQLLIINITIINIMAIINIYCFITIHVSSGVIVFLFIYLFSIIIIFIIRITVIIIICLLIKFYNYVHNFLLHFYFIFHPVFINCQVTL